MQDGIDKQRQPSDVLHWQDKERLQRQTLCLGSVLQSRKSCQELLLLPDSFTGKNSYVNHIKFKNTKQLVSENPFYVPVSDTL